MKRIVVGLLVLLAAVSIPAAEAAQKSLRLGRSFVLNGVVIAPGDYRVELAPALDAVRLMRGKDVVVSSPCTVSPVGGTIPGNEVHSRSDSSGREEIVRLVLAGPQLSIQMLPSPAAAAGGNQGPTGVTGPSR
jgi:hypothetical protein